MELLAPMLPQLGGRQALHAHALLSAALTYASVALVPASAHRRSSVFFLPPPDSALRLWEASQSPQLFFTIAFYVLTWGLGLKGKNLLHF